MKRFVLGTVTVGLALAVSVWLTLRSWPVPVDEVHSIGPEVHVAGDWVQAKGGFEAVRQLAAPKATMADLDRIIAQSPRVTRLEGRVEEGLVTYVVRAQVTGMRDIVNLWVEGDRLHLRARPVFGTLWPEATTARNRARIEAWLLLAAVPQAD